MSLLWMDYDAEFQALLDHVAAMGYDCACSTPSPRVYQIIYRDTRYNIDFLYTAYQLGDSKIIEDYAVWLYQLLRPILKNQSASATADYIVRHFENIRAAVRETFSDEKERAALDALLILAEDCVRKAQRTEITLAPQSPRYEDEISRYLEKLFSRDTRGALFLVRQWVEKGIPLSDIYVDILAESMRRVGELWHTAQISVDVEHYCTSVTQMAMAQMYSSLFSGETKDKVILCACPGTELHEMGARMVADLFENDGWESIYLGAAVPVESMLTAIKTYRPTLLALSVTMPQHLLACRDMIAAVRQSYPDVKIAVGGKAFSSTNALWTHWDIDLYAQDARELLRDADALCS